MTPKIDPGRGQNRHKIAQGGQGAPQERPWSAQERPRPLQNKARRAPSQIFRMIFVASLVPQASGTIFHRFVLTRNTRHVRKTSKKPAFFLCFCISGACAKSRHACAQNTEKIKAGGSKNTPGRVPNPPKSTPQRSRTQQNQPRTPTSRQEARK